MTRIVFSLHEKMFSRLRYLSLCEHTDVGGGICGIIIVAVGEDGAVEEGQIITGWMVQLHLQKKVSKKLRN